MAFFLKKSKLNINPLKCPLKMMGLLKAIGPLLAAWVQAITFQLLRGSYREVVTPVKAWVQNNFKLFKILDSDFLRNNENGLS
jgi:hypothetical protein